MKVLAIMQNQWFLDPEAIKRIFERRPTMRRQLIARFLFAGCRSGRVLQSVFGDRINKIVWEEASPQIGGESSACFPADPEHLRAVLGDVKPDVVLAFGRIASEGLRTLVSPAKLIVGPHPTSRGGDVIERLTEMRQRLERLQPPAAQSSPSEAK